MPNMQPLRPIRPTISLLRLLLLAFVLYPSVDHLGGASLLGVLAAPTISPNPRPPPAINGVLPTAPASPNRPTSTSPPGASASNPNHKLMVAPASPNRPMSMSPPATSHSDSTAMQLPFGLIRKSRNGRVRREKLEILHNEILQGQIGGALVYTHKGDEAILQTSNIGSGGCDPGDLMGTITFRSLTTMKDSLNRMRHELSQIKPEDAVSALFFIAFGVFLLEEDPDVLDVQMKREWYVMLRNMILMGISGEGKAISPNDEAKWNRYLLMGKKLNDALKDPNISEKQMNEFFDLRKIPTDTLTDYYS
ncbi:hypothetical protein C8R42DRAFT_663096 [Lentinula raphanica]|nr:hypothetical protein C8R42DRAFT_663096 [Lentinula raphanica]